MSADEGAGRTSGGSGTARGPCFARVAIVGVGLIGGSLAAAIRARGLADVVVGFDRPASLAEASRAGLIDEGATTLAEAAADADLVVLATPPSAMAAVFAALAPVLGPRTIVSDCASTKQTAILAARAGLGSAFERFVPAHPIAGSEHSGTKAARADLLPGCRLMLCPEPETDPAAEAAVEALWLGLDARVVRVSAADHDRLYAEISHWPHAVAFALAGAIADGPWSAEAGPLSGAGLRDTTRIAASSPALWADILLDNREACLASAARVDAALAALRMALEVGDREELVRRLENASRWRAAF